MSQAMYTSASGMNNAQTAINVVSNNIANMNTIAFKESHVNYSDVFYNVLSSGSPSGELNGGVNPMEVGYGSQISSISQNFTTGTFQSTGISTNMMIQGNGFFTVLSPSDEMLYTKAGDFTVDSEGYLVMPNGYRVMGTDTIFGTAASKTPVKIPQMIHSEVTANENAGSKALSDLNGTSGITAGTFDMDISYTDAGVVKTEKIEVTLDGTEANLNDIAAKINAALNGKPDAIKNGVTAKVNNGKFEIATTGTVTDIAFTSGTSNFLSETQLATAEAEGGVYSSKVLDWKADISASINKQADLKASSQSFYENGTVEITYSNGDKLTVEQISGTNELQFKYTTKAGITLRGDEVTVSEDVATTGNLQLQLAHFMNPDGLSLEGNNLYGVGVNDGWALYGVANSNMFGGIKSGGIEASNVDLTKQFSDMIIAQRAIEANSRVFNTANQVMQSLVYLGQ